MEHKLITQSRQKEQLEKSSSASPSQSNYAGGVTAHPVLRLQRAIGNQAVQRMVREGENDKQTQRSSDIESSSTSSHSVHHALKSPGRPLATSTRAFMESRFGHDFSQVQIHTDARAAESARAINALAYTVGKDIVFGAGQYAPQSTTGQRVLAHELTHVVQQSEAVRGNQRLALLDSSNETELEREAETQAARVVGGQGDGSVRVQGRLAVARLQRVADISQAPTDLQCSLLTGGVHLDGTNILFDISSSTLTASQKADIAIFANMWVSDGSIDDVQLDGYASVDGGQALNWRLSCERAEAVKTELIALGVPAKKIVTVAHGETTEFSATDLVRNRRVIISRHKPLSPPKPPSPTPTAPQLTAAISVGPDPGTCGGTASATGAMNFVIQWNLSKNSGINGGFIIQDITFIWDVRDCENAPVANSDTRTSPLRYFEAWKVDPNSTNLSPINTDHFTWPNNAPWAGKCTTGHVTIRAVARYHDNVPAAAMPAHMVVNNPNTFAGILQSSLTDPVLGGNISSEVPHRLVFRWQCCPCANNKVIVEAHTP